MRTLVTGSTGRIGNAIAQALTARGDQVVALVRDPRRARAMLPETVELLTGDICDPATLPVAVKDAEVVFHAAGLPEQWARDRAVFDRVNRQGTANVLAAAHDAGVRRVIYTSTLDVFRKDADGMLRETALDPDPKPSVYERSKQAAEREVEHMMERGLDVVFLNPAGVYGPSPTTTGISALFARLLNGKMPMLPPGGVSLAYVAAVAAAHLAAVERGKRGERYLLADGFVTIRELGEMIAKVAGLKRVPPSAPVWLVKTLAAVGEPLGRLTGIEPMISRDGLGFLLWRAKIDSSKAQTQLGYTPMPLEDGIRAAVADLRSRGIAR